MKEKLLISACLLGVPCRYDGKSKICEGAMALSGTYEVVPFCPECYGGLPTPRVPAEIQGDRVVAKDGRDVTTEYQRGAESALSLCHALGIRSACLKARSPSCGVGQIYDGTFSGKLVPGDGVAAHYLKENGITVFTEEDL